MIYAVNIDFDLQLFYDRFQLHLPSNVIKKCDKYHFADDRKRCLTGKLLKRVLLAKHLNSSISELEFDVNRYGKPQLIRHNQKSLHFNLSHSGDWVVIAIDNEPLGIDIELIQPQIPDVEKIVFTENEIKQIYSVEQDQHINRFFNQWTRKESYIKAMGMGFSANLEMISILESANGTIRIETNSSDKNWVIRDIPFDPKYSLSVCSRNQISDEISILNIETLINSDL